MSFRMKLASLPANMAAFEALQFLAQCHDDRGRVTRSIDPVRGPVVGTEVEYGISVAGVSCSRAGRLGCWMRCPMWIWPGMGGSRGWC